MHLSIKTWITFFLLTLIMGMNNIYSSLLTGWGYGGSIVAVILCLLVMTKEQGNIINYNLGQTMASAGGSVGFTVAIFAAVYYVQAQDGGWHPNLFHLSLLVMSLSLMGVALAIPLRKYVIHWFFPSAVACATILRAVTSKTASDQIRTKKNMAISGLVSLFITLPTKMAITPNGPPLLRDLKFTQNLSLTSDPLLYGIGIVVGCRIGFSMLLGGLSHVFLLSPYFTYDAVRWVAVGLMTVPAFTSLLFAYFFKSDQKKEVGFTPQKQIATLNGKESLIVFLLFIAAFFAASLEMNTLFGISWSAVFLATAFASPLCVALGKVASETDINPIRLLAVALLLIFSLFEGNSPTKLLAFGICGATFAALAVDLFYDLRTGYLIGANPKQQIAVQFLGVIPVSFATVYFLDLLVRNFGIGEGKYFPAPGAVIWATMAKAFAAGANKLPGEAWYLLGVSTLIGVLMTFFQNLKSIQWLIPSPFALGIALLLPFEMSAAIFLGSLLRLGSVAIAKRKGDKAALIAEDDAFKSGSAILAASSLAGILAVFLITFGIFYLPNLTE